MTQNLYEMNPVQAITVGAVGEPGNRVFYIQARTLKETITLHAEKEQVQMLARGIHQLLDEIIDKSPAKSQDSPSEPPDLELRPPFEPQFRVGKLELGYDVDSELVLLIAHELIPEDPDAEEDLAPDAASVARFWATRAQMRGMADHALEVVARGRPVCVLCGQSYDAEGHVCPKRNGHSSTPVTF